MAGVPKIPETLWEVVREQARGGWPTRQIADWLKEFHGLKVSHVSVGELLERLKAEEKIERKTLYEEEAADRRELRAKVSSRIAATIGLTLDGLDAQGKRLELTARRLYRKVKSGNQDVTGAYLKAETELRRAIELRLKLAGIDPDDDKNELVSAAAEVRRKLAQKLASGGDGGGAQLDRPDGSRQGGASLRVGVLGAP